MRSLLKAGTRAAVAAAFIVLLASCGGGGGNPGQCVAGSAQTCAANTDTTTAASSSAASTASSQSYAGICTLEGEKQFTRAYLNEVYLWYSEMPALDASLFNTVPAYFYSLLTPQKDSWGQLKDRFSFIVKSSDADSLETGANLGYGVRWETDSQGRTRVGFVDAGSPAEAAGLARGGELVSAPSDARWYPNAATSISFVYRSSPSAATRTVSLTTAEIQEDPVPKSTATTTDPRTWYLLFNAHTKGAQDKLITALGNAKAAGAQNLVLDMRYNGGGYLYTALSLASMVTGSGADGKVFEQLRFNDKRAAETADSTYRFSGQVQYGEQAYATGAVLPRLNLPRVYILTTDGTCSASESVINSLRGVGVDVVIIGNTTCGKPYGFSRTDNCGYSYYPIEFQGVNDKGFGDYANGFAPTCAVADDFDNALGSSSERLLSTALYHMQNGSCPSQAVSGLLAWRGPAMSTPSSAPVGGKLVTGLRLR